MCKEFHDQLRSGAALKLDANRRLFHEHWWQPRTLIARLDATTGLADSFDPSGWGIDNFRYDFPELCAVGRIFKAAPTLCPTHKSSGSAIFLPSSCSCRAMIP
jgi:hypothetical protein